MTKLLLRTAMVLAVLSIAPTAASATTLEREHLIASPEAQTVYTGAYGGTLDVKIYSDGKELGRHVITSCQAFYGHHGLSIWLRVGKTRNCGSDALPAQRMRLVFSSMMKRNPFTVLITRSP